MLQQSWANSGFESSVRDLFRIQGQNPGCIALGTITCNALNVQLLLPAVILYGIYRPSLLSFSPTHTHTHTHTHTYIRASARARTDAHKSLLISWPFVYSWYVVEGEMIGQIRHLISWHTHVVCMNAAIAVMLFYSYAPTCTARLQWVFWAPGSGSLSGRSKGTRIQHNQNHF